MCGNNKANYILVTLQCAYNKKKLFKAFFFVSLSIDNQPQTHCDYIYIYKLLIYICGAGDGENINNLYITLN